jgi:DNA repair protein RadC
MLSNQDQAIVDQSIGVIASYYERKDLFANSADNVKQFCQLNIGSLEHEVFGCLFLDNQHRLIKFVEMFRGTINQATVYPREVVKEALLCNAAAIIFTHNHPSGDTGPSSSDIELTQKLCKALSLFDINVLDHIIVSKIGSYSFAEKGLMTGL